MKIRFFCPALLLIVLTSCSSTPPNYYMLSTFAEPVMVAENPDGPAIGLEHLQLPTYLDKTRLVRRTGENTLDVYQNDQWSEPLDAGVQRVLADSLAARVPGARVHSLPWPRRFDPEYRIAITITRFDADADGTVQLSGNWSITRHGQSEREQRRHYNIRRVTQGESHAAVAATMSAALAELAEQIAQPFHQPGSRP